jgi:hypothetical protein
LFSRVSDLCSSTIRYTCWGAVRIETRRLRLATCDSQTACDPCMSPPPAASPAPLSISAPHLALLSPVVISFIVHVQVIPIALLIKAQSRDKSIMRINRTLAHCRSSNTITLSTAMVSGAYGAVHVHVSLPPATGPIVMHEQDNV